MIAAGIAPSVGFVVSWTVIVNEPGALVLPAASFAVQVTVFEPRGKVLPDAGLHVTVGVETASLAVGVAYVAARPAAEVASRI